MIEFIIGLGAVFVIWGFFHLIGRLYHKITKTQRTSYSEPYSVMGFGILMLIIVTLPLLLAIGMGITGLGKIILISLGVLG